MAALLDALQILGKDEAAQAILHAPILNTRDTVVGERRPNAAFVDSLRASLRG
jgi:hypothetical protein